MAPGNYWFEDLKAGDWFETGHLVVTEAHIVAFAGLSGDFFDVHMDDEFARAQGFAGRIAHGLLGLALTDGLKNRASVRIMAIASLGWNWSFTGPIVAGDRIGVKIAVKEDAAFEQGAGDCDTASQGDAAGGARGAAGGDYAFDETQCLRKADGWFVTGNGLIWVDERCRPDQGGQGRSLQLPARRRRC